MPTGRMMRIQRHRPSEWLASHRVHTAVVIDVIRMTSTAATLIRRPACRELLVAAGPETLARLGLPLSDLVLISELAGLSGAGLRVDNSPAQVARLELGNRTPLLVTTNGTRALFRAAEVAERVLLASFLDVRAVAAHLTANEEPSVAILPAGDFRSGESRIEDERCAEALELLLAGREPEFAAYEAEVRSEPRVRYRIAHEPGFADDLDLSLRSDPGSPVLQFQQVDIGIGRIFRALGSDAERDGLPTSPGS